MSTGSSDSRSGRSRDPGVVDRRTVEAEVDRERAAIEDGIGDNRLPVPVTTECRCARCFDRLGSPGSRAADEDVDAVEDLDAVEVVASAFGLVWMPIELP